MKSVFALGVLAAAPAVQAHYIFTQLMIGGKAIGSDYTYMRKNSNTYMPSFTNDIVNSPNLRCNSGATTGTAQTYTVAAGTKVGFKIWFNEKIEHPGPAMVYMSKAPGELNSYDGSGDWFKVYEDGLCGGTNAGVDTNWCSWQKDNIEFTIPAALPPGNYLTRVEHIGIHEAHVGKAQFYMECAHLKVTGSGTGTPGPLVKIPGMYKATDPGIAYNKWSGNPPAYVIPGPKVWSGGSAKATDGTTTPVEAPAAEAPATEAPATEAPVADAPVADAPVAEAPPATGGAGAAMWAQCGGQGWSGAKACAAGSCKVINEYYSQCA